MPEIAKPPCILTGSQNWHLWSLRIEAQLRVHSAWDILTNKTADKDDKDTAEKAKEKQEIAIGLILNSLSDSILESLPRYTDIKALWQFLEKKYNGSNKTQSLQGLQTVMKTLSSDCLNIEDYIAKVENGIRLIKSRLSSEKKEQFPEWFLCDLLLANLDDPHWEIFVTIHLNESKESSFKDLAAQMIEHEKRMQYQDSLSNVVRAKKGKQLAKASREERREERKAWICDYCGKNGHKKEACWQLHPELKPERFKSHTDHVNVDVAFEEGTHAVF